VRWQKIALLVFLGWHFVGWQKTKCAICGLGFLSFFCGGEEKNKINSSKFAPTYQRAKFLF
jgi:hypothetical protein